MKNALLAIGNSSSFIVEAPSLRVPSVNIGNREKGRIMANSVFNISWEDNIVRKVNEIINLKDRIDYKNPYLKEGGFENTLERIRWILEKKRG